MDKLQKVRDKHGYQPSDDNMSTRLIQAEKVREVQRENKKLADIISKQRTIHTWFRSKSRSKFELMSADFQSNTDRTTKENLEKGIFFMAFISVWAMAFYMWVEGTLQDFLNGYKPYPLYYPKLGFLYA